MSIQLELLPEINEPRSYKGGVEGFDALFASNSATEGTEHNLSCFGQLERPASGTLAQSVAALPLHGRGRQFEPGRFHQSSCNLPLSGRSGLVALVDEEDFERVSAFKWYPLRSHSLTYAYAKVPNTTKSLLLHRLVMGSPMGFFIDHRDRARTLDCRKSNLRIATPAQNQANRKSARNGYKGVSFWAGKYSAAIGFERKRIRLGCFVTEAEAARAYDRKALELYGEFALLNFPATATVAA